MQGELASHPKADIRVFAVWFRMYPGDSEQAFPADLLTDRRVIHRWDEPKAAGKWFLANLRSMHPSHGGGTNFPQRVDAMWDTWMLFDKSATWKSEKPTGLVSWGYPIVRSRGQLQQDFRALTN